MCVKEKQIGSKHTLTCEFLKVVMANLLTNLIWVVMSGKKYLEKTKREPKNDLNQKSERK